MKWLLLLGFVIATIVSLAISPAKQFENPELARIVVFHLPCAFSTTIFVLAGAVSSIAYLRTRRWEWEQRAAAANEMGLTLAFATMSTGILFSQAQWRQWWSWDPRQTSFLIVLLILGSYMAVRMAFEEPVARARAAAGYSAIALLPLLFLIFVFPRLPQVAQASLHPQDVVTRRDGFSGDYWAAIFFVFGLMLWLCGWLTKLHVRAAQAVEAWRDA